MTPKVSMVLLAVALGLAVHVVIEQLLGDEPARVEPADDEDGPTWEECPYVAV